MPLKNCSPKLLARMLYAELERRKSPRPPLEVLTSLFESMYFASMKTEESEKIAFHIVYMDPENPDPTPPLRVRKDRWSCVRLSDQIPVTVSSLVKLGKASDPRSSSFAVYHKKNGLFVWGLIDQGNRYHEFINYDSESGPERPGLFQASITGIGRVAAYIGYEKIGELKINTLPPKPVDVLRGGPIRGALQPGISSYLENVQGVLLDKRYKTSLPWDEIQTSRWVSTVCRLLLRVQNLRHGGAVLITPDTSFKGLNVKYTLLYSRLRSALERQGILSMQSRWARERINYDYLAKSAAQIPVELYLEDSVLEDELADIANELDGVIWFIALLTRVDGLVLMTPSLDVQAFGVEITSFEEPSSVLVAGDYRATKSLLRNVDYKHYGTRHRSMMRYCLGVPGSVGFVISQDGDVRAMTQVHRQVVIWDDIRLQLDDFQNRRT